MRGMRGGIAVGAAIVCLAAVARPASANDFTAHLTAGGLRIPRNDAIEMQSEDLFACRWPKSACATASITVPTRT